jgi:hypothetical protein
LTNSLVLEEKNKAVDSAATIPVLGIGGVTDHPWCRLQELPCQQTERVSFFNDAVRDHEINTGTHLVTCFVCNQVVTVPMDNAKRYAFKSWDTVHRSSKLRYKAFIEHCEQMHPDQPLWSLDIRDNYYSADHAYEVRDRVQWCLVQAIEKEELPLQRFNDLMEGDSFPLRYKLGQLFASARAYNYAADTLRKVAPNAKFVKEWTTLHKPKGGDKTKRETSEAIDNIFRRFKCQVALYLSKLEVEFLRWDFRMVAGELSADTLRSVETTLAAQPIPPFVQADEKQAKTFKRRGLPIAQKTILSESNVCHGDKESEELKRKALLLWNLSHLLFYRGVYMEPPFFPSFVEIPASSRCTLYDFLPTKDTHPVLSEFSTLPLDGDESDKSVASIADSILENVAI